MRTFENWLHEAEGFQGKMTPDHDAKKGAIEVKNLLGDNKPKALPAAADKGSAIVRQKRGGTGKEAIGGNKMKSGPGVRQPDKGPGSKTYDRTIKDGSALTKYKPKPKPEPKTRVPHKSSFRDGLKQGVTGGLAGGSERDRQKAKRSLGNKIGSGVRTAPGKALSALGKSVANQAKKTSQDQGEKMQDAQVTSAKRGVYNP